MRYKNSTSDSVLQKRVTRVFKKQCTIIYSPPVSVGPFLYVFAFNNATFDEWTAVKFCITDFFPSLLISIILFKGWLGPK
jgi:hypothetical protein